MTAELALRILRLPPQYTMEQLQEAYTRAVQRAHPEEDPGAFHLANLAYQALRGALARQGDAGMSGAFPKEAARAKEGSAGKGGADGRAGAGGVSWNAQDLEDGWGAADGRKQEDSAEASVDFALEDAEDLDFESVLAEAEQQEAEAYRQRIREALQELEALLARRPVKKRVRLFHFGKGGSKPRLSPMQQAEWDFSWKTMWRKFQDEGFAADPYFISSLHAYVESSEIEIWQEEFFKKLYQEAPIESWYASMRTDARAISPSYRGIPLGERKAAAALFLAFLRKKKREAEEEKKRQADRRMLFSLFLLPLTLGSPYTAMVGAFLFFFILLSAMKSEKIGRNFCLCGFACALTGRAASAWLSFYLPGGEGNIPIFAFLSGQSFWPMLALRYAPWAQEGIEAAEGMTLAARNNTGMFIVMGRAFFLLGILILSVSGFAKIHEYYRKRMK